MEQRKGIFPRVRYSILSALFVATLAVSTAMPPLAPAQTSSTSLPCSWPIEVTGRGATNVFNPDTDATYWAMPVDTTQWEAMEITAKYPEARFFSFVTYRENGGAVDSIVDADLAPDPGSTNPFQPASTQPGTPSESRDYSLTIDGSANGSGNHIHWGNTTVAYVIYRVYVPDRGRDRRGAAPFPQVTLVDTNGNAHATQVCASALSTAQLPPSIASLGGGSSGTGSTSCPSTQQPQQDVVPFVVNTSQGGAFPNPATQYAAARGLCSQAGRVLVIRGKGAVYPDTYNGTSIFVPAIPGEIQLRYWSLCNNLESSPFPVVDCRADHATRLDNEGYYTYVIAPLGEQDQPDELPARLSHDVSWLRWGDVSVTHDLLFRDMLPMPDFSLTGEYLPQGVYCDRQLFIGEGWQGCFVAAGLTAP